MHITHLYKYVYCINIIIHSIRIMYTTLILIIHLFQIIRSKPYETCPYSEQIILPDNINKFVNNQYMNAFIKHI